METLPLVLPRTPGSTQRDSSSGAGRSARRGPATTERRPRQSDTTVEPASVWPAHHHHRFRATWCPRRGHGRLLGWLFGAEKRGGGDGTSFIRSSPRAERG